MAFFVYILQINFQSNFTTQNRDRALKRLYNLEQPTQPLQSVPSWSTSGLTSVTAAVKPVHRLLASLHQANCP